MIEIVKLSHAYGNQEPALVDVDCTLSANCVAILGPNGAGKSTLLTLLTTIQPVQQGTIRVERHDLSQPGGARQVRAVLGYLPQSMQLPNGYSCGEFMAYAAWMRKVNNPSAVCDAALAQVGLLERKDQQIGKLSGGMRQRLCVAQALVSKPSVLVVDEPSVGLDPQQRVRLREVLRGLDCQVILASHLVDDVAGLADEVLILDGGSATFHGSVATLCGVPDSEDVTAAAVERGYLQHVGASE